MSKYTAIGLCEYAERQLGRPYWNGTFGQLASKDLYEQKKYGQKLDYGPWEGDYEKAVGQKVHDCNGLFKGYLWCDGPDSGNYHYQNVMGDNTVKQIYNDSTAKGDLGSIPKVRGVLVFTKTFSHMGIYVGDGYVIEARGHAYGVVKTKLHERSWALWCKSKYVDYAGAEESDTPSQPTSGSAQIMTFQTWINKYLPMQYLGAKLDVDGKFGPLTRKAAIKCLQYWLNKQYGTGLAVDGGYGPLTKAACKVLRKGSSGDGVYILQGLLYCHGYDPKGFDGSFGVYGGTGCLNAVKAFQADKGLEVDGEAGPLTFEKLCKA